MKLGKLIQKPELVFVFIASFFGLISAFLLPILEVPDENQHFQVEYAMFSSNKEAANDLVFSRDLVLSEDHILSAVQQDDYLKYFTEKTSAQYDGFAINTETYVFDGKTKSSVYDVMRLPQAIGILIGRMIYPSIGVMVVMGRLVMLALYIAALYFIIKKIRFGKWVLVFVACLPIMIQQAASLSYDPMNLLAIFAWVAFIVNLATQKAQLTRKRIISGVLLALLLLISKSNNVLLLGLIFALPKEYITSTRLFQSLRARTHWRLIRNIALAIIGIAICALLYVMAKKILAGQEFHPRRLFDVLLNTFFWGDLTLINVTFVGIVGQFSNFYYSLPAWLVFIALMVLVLVMMFEKLPDVSRRFALISGSLFFGSILLISIAMYYGWAMRHDRFGPGAEVTDGIQGRYFAPLLILLFPLFAYIQKYIKITTKSKNFVPVLAMSTSVLFLTFYTLQTWDFFWR